MRVDMADNPEMEDTAENLRSEVQAILDYSTLVFSDLEIKVGKEAECPGWTFPQITADRNPGNQFGE